MEFSAPSDESSSHCTNIMHTVAELLHSPSALLWRCKLQFCSLLHIQTWHQTHYFFQSNLSPFLTELPHTCTSFPCQHSWHELWEGSGNRRGRVISHHTSQGFKLVSLRIWFLGKWVPLTGRHKLAVIQTQRRKARMASGHVRSVVLVAFLWSLRGDDFGWVVAYSIL